MKLAAIGAVAVIFALAFAPREFALVLAQQYNPLIAPVPAPSAPAQLPAPVTTAVAPVLVPVPMQPTPSPTPSLRVFNCSCYGRGNGTHWVGRVTAQSYFGARQAAVGACFAYNFNRAPESPFMPPGGSTSNIPPIAGALPPGIANEPLQALPGKLNFSTAAQRQNCSVCTCD